MARKPIAMNDGLMNAITGLGTSADPRNASAYRFCPLSANQIENAYRGSGMMRKCIEIPALDMVRAWRDWQADDADIELLEAEETRLGLRQKIYQAEILRGLGGGAIIMGLPGLPNTAVGKVAKGGLAFLHVISRYQMTLGPVDTDPLSANYGLPKHFMVNDGKQTQVHPSRVVCFTGDPIPQLTTSTWDDQFWGESRIQRLMNAVKNSDTAQDAFAALLHKAKITRVGIPGLLDIVSDAGGEQKLSKRLAAMAAGESIHNSTLFDSGNGSTNPGETITDFQVAWAGMADVMAAFDKRLCAVADIPATRLLGESPGGLNASGGGQQQDWHKHVNAMQELRLRPCVDKLDVAIVPSATGKVADKSIWYQWAALDVPDEKTVAEVNKLNIESAVMARDTGALPDAAFAEGFQSLMVASGLLPALETALEKVAEAERFAVEPEPVEGSDPSALTGEAEA